MHLVFDVRPHHDTEQAELGGEHEDKGRRKQPIDGYRDRDARQRPFPAGEVLVFGGEVEERREREETPAESEHALICETTFSGAIFQAVPDASHCVDRANHRDLWCGDVFLTALHGALTC